MNPTNDQTTTLVAAISDELGCGLTELQNDLLELFSTGKTNSTKVIAMLNATKHALYVTKTSQQISRLIQGGLRQTNERISLKDLLTLVLTERAAEFKRANIEIKPILRAIDVLADPELMFMLMNAAIDWGTQRCNKVSINLDIKNWPQYAVLTVRAHATSNGYVKKLGVAELLLSEITRTLGASIKIQRSVHGDSIMIEFPRTVREIEGMVAVDMEDAVSGFNQISQPLAGRRVLVISADSKLRNDLRHATENFDITLDVALSTKQAVEYCALQIPDIIIFDEEIRNDEFDELCNNLRSELGVFPIIEIAVDANAFQVSGWAQDSYSRIGRDAIHTHLNQTMAMELAKTM